MGATVHGLLAALLALAPLSASRYVFVRLYMFGGLYCVFLVSFCTTLFFLPVVLIQFGGRAFHYEPNEEVDAVEDELPLEKVVSAEATGTAANM